MEMPRVRRMLRRREPVNWGKVRTTDIGVRAMLRARVYIIDEDGSKQAG